MGGTRVGLRQTTSYPWQGDITLDVTPRRATDFALRIRIPGWVRGDVVPSDLYRYADGKRLSYSISVNGQKVESDLDKGYFTVERRWRKGDRVEIHFDMEPRVVEANPHVEADRGRVAVERGPIVYCAEWPDNDFSVRSVLMNRTPQFETEFRGDMLYGIQTVKTRAQTLRFDESGRLVADDVTLTMIPYYAWAHRGAGEMTVWLPSDLTAANPVAAPTIASQAKVTASTPTAALSAVSDGMMPKKAGDRSMPYYHWWPEKASTQWIAYEFEEQKSISESTVYWFDDSPWGGCRVPAAWRLYYRDANGEWVAIEPRNGYPVMKDAPCTADFEPVRTSAIKLEVQLPADNSAGVFEWSVK